MTDVDAISVKAAFDTATTYSEWSLIAVTLGVFVELIALFVFSKEMPRREKIVMICATALIVAGCAGEYVFGFRARTAAEQLQQASDERTALAYKEAANAQKEAARANESAMIIANALENERSKLIAMLQQLKPRILTRDQMNVFADAVRGRTGRVRLYMPSDQEGHAFAFSLLKAFQFAGVSVEPIQCGYQPCPLPRQVLMPPLVVYINPPEGSTGPGQILADALIKLGAGSVLMMGLGGSTEELPGVPSPSIFVGPREIPFGTDQNLWIGGPRQPWDKK